METVKKEYNFETHEGFPTTDLLYDKQEKAILNILYITTIILRKER